MLFVIEVDNDGFKVYDSAGNLIDPAKDASVTALGTILTAIKDTDGIKKIVDALPTGTNEIGKVAQGTKAAGSAAWPIVLYDASGNAISILSDGGVYRVQTVGKLLNASGAQINPATEDTLALIKTTDGIKKIVDPLPTGSNTIGKVDQGAGGASAWKVDGSSVTQPISATSLPLPTGAATESGNLASIKTDLDNIYTRQADGNQKAIVRGGAKGTTTAADVTSTVEGADHQALDVQVMHGGSAKDPTQVRALTSADVVTANQGTAAAVAAAWPAKITDGTNVADILVDGGVKRLRVDATLTAGVSSQVEGRAADGAPPVGYPVLIGGQDGANVQSILTDTLGRIVTVNAGTPITNLVTDYLKDGSTYQMKVNGTVPKIYTYSADPTKDITLLELRFVYSAAAFAWSGNGFGKDAAGKLTNGILIELIVNGGVTVTLATVQVNEDFLRTFGDVPVITATVLGDVMTPAWKFTGGSSLILKAGTADKVRVTIRDNLTGGALGVNYLTATFFGTKAI